MGMRRDRCDRGHIAGADVLGQGALHELLEFLLLHSGQDTRSDSSTHRATSARGRYFLCLGLGFFGLGFGFGFGFSFGAGPVIVSCVPLTVPSVAALLTVAFHL